MSQSLFYKNKGIPKFTHTSFRGKQRPVSNFKCWIWHSILRSGWRSAIIEPLKCSNFSMTSIWNLAESRQACGRARLECKGTYAVPSFGAPRIESQFMN